MTTPPLPPDPGSPDTSGDLSAADQEPTMPTHLDLDELADLAVGELAEVRPAAEAHLAGCGACQERLAQVTADLDLVGVQLSGMGAADAGPMPVTVATRLDRVLAEEVGTGSGGQPGTGSGSSAGSGGSGSVSPFVRPMPLKAPATASYVKQTGVVRIMLAAAVAAAVVGFGGYALSAAAGLNEPAAISPAQVQPTALAEQARTLAESRDLDPHLFSAAWYCARAVTTGRITGITPVWVDGEQSYLVYTRTGGRTYATLVSGCDGGEPNAGERVALTE